jgi:hypothetical protein
VGHWQTAGRAHETRPAANSALSLATLMKVDDEALHPMAEETQMRAPSSSMPPQRARQPPCALIRSVGFDAVHARASVCERGAVGFAAIASRSK